MPKLMAKQYTAKYKSLPPHSVTNNSGIVEKNTGETPDRENKTLPTNG